MIAADDVGFAEHPVAHPHASISNPPLTGRSESLAVGGYTGHCFVAHDYADR